MKDVLLLGMRSSRDFSLIFVGLLDPGVLLHFAPLPLPLSFPPPPWQPGYALDRERGGLADDCLYSVALPGVVVFADPAIRSGKPKNSHLEEPSDEVMGGFLGERGAPSVIVMRVSRRRSETKTRPAQSENRYYYCRLLLGSTRVVGVSWIEGRKTGTNGEGFEKKVGLCVCSSGCREMNRVVLQPA